MNILPLRTDSLLINPSDGGEDGPETQSQGIPGPAFSGMLPTPSPLRFTVFNEDTFEDGYDSDGQVPPEPDEELVTENALPSNLNGISSPGDPGQSAPALSPVSQPLDDPRINVMNCLQLRAELKSRGQSVKGKREELVARLKDAVARGIPPGNSTVQAPNIDGFPPHCRWEELTFESDPLPLLPRVIDGVLFRHPTQEDAPVQEKRLYNTTCQIDRRPFIQQALHPKERRNGVLVTDNKGAFIYENRLTKESVVNIEFAKKHHLSIDSKPVEWFEAFFPVKNPDKNCKFSVERMTTWTNDKARAVNAGPGGVIYRTFRNFTVDDVKKHLALYLVNALVPHPCVEEMFQRQIDDPIFGNDLISNAFPPQAALYHKHFKAFFHALTRTFNYRRIKRA